MNPAASAISLTFVVAITVDSQSIASCQEPSHSIRYPRERLRNESYDVTMFSLPTFLTSFSLPSLPSISLPTNIQRRFLSYVLKRALGRFFRSGLDVEEIQSQIGEGKVELEGLVINEEVRDQPM